jgi:hypothetical protein
MMSGNLTRLFTLAELISMRAASGKLLQWVSLTPFAPVELYSLAVLGRMINCVSVSSSLSRICLVKEWLVMSKRGAAATTFVHIQKSCWLQSASAGAA